MPRSLTIDIMKVIGMYLIILGHMYPLDTTILIYGVNGPVFFLISGYLYKNRDFKQFLTTCFLYMLLPIILFAIISRCLFCWPLNQWPQNIFYSTIYGLCGFHSINGCGIFEGWFAYSIIILHLLRKLCGLKLLTLLAPLMLIASNWLDHQGINPMSAFLNALVVAPIYVAGAWIRNFKDSKGHIISALKANRSVLFWICAISLTTIGAFVYNYLSEWNGLPWLYLNKHGRSMTCFVIVGILGSGLLYAISYGLAKLCSNTLVRRIILLLSEGNVLVMCTHILFLPDISNSSKYLVALGIYLAFLPLLWLMRRYAPALLGKRPKPRSHTLATN